MEYSIPTQLVKSHVPSSDPTASTIICPICHSIYAPSRFHTYLLQAPSIAMESAFLGMCHFCFRCRRPSCPDCWDGIHCICAQCAQETQVSFRSTLEETPLHSSYGNRPIYERPTPPPTPKIITSSIPDIDNIKNRPDRTNSLDIDNIKTRPEHPNTPNIDNIKTRPTISSPQRKPGRAILSLTLFLVFLIVIMVAVSLLSVDGNQFIYTLFHINIRAQLTTLWHAILDLFQV